MRTALMLDCQNNIGLKKIVSKLLKEKDSIAKRRKERLSQEITPKDIGKHILSGYELMP